MEAPISAAAGDAGEHAGAEPAQVDVAAVDVRRRRRRSTFERRLVPEIDAERRRAPAARRCGPNGRVVGWFLAHRSCGWARRAGLTRPAQRSNMLRTMPAASLRESIGVDDSAQGSVAVRPCFASQCVGSEASGPVSERDCRRRYTAAARKSGLPSQVAKKLPRAC